MNNTFINPYNFVPFGTKIEESGHKKTKQEVYMSDSSKLLSGWLDIDIYIKTPLIIPDGAHPKYYRLIGDKNNASLSKEPFIPSNDYEKNSSHKAYSFQKLPSDDGTMKYSIPGSELRGVIRSAYESVTDSCVPFLLKDGSRLSQRVPIFGSLHRRGLLCLENGKWKLYSAKTVGTDEVTIKKEMQPDKKGKPTAKYKLFRINGGEVLEKTGDFSKKYNGVVQYNIPVDIKKTYHVVYLQKNELIKEWSNDEPYQNMCSVLDRDAAHKNGNNPNQGPCNDLKMALEREHKGKNNALGVPVYYFYVTPNGKDEGSGEKLVYLSNSAIGRIAQRRKWKDIIGEHVPCNGKGELCPACLLFGTKEGDGLKGRVRFTDAFSDDRLSIEKHCLGILGGPRPSAFEFYLNRPFDDATYWNFDFYGIKVQQGDRTITEYRHLDKATPKGRKMYWHLTPQSDATPSNQNSTMEAIGSGVFYSKVYFDGITKTQLNDLMWVISMGDNTPDSPLQFKLGHAKPLGYGSTKLVVSAIHKREFLKAEDGAISFRVSKEIPNIEDLSYGLDNDMVKTFLAMADFGTTSGENVEYPNGAIKTFEWFAKNRTNADTLTVLPDPLSGNIVQKNNEKSSGGFRKETAKNKNGKQVTVNSLTKDRKDPTKYVAYYDGGMVFDVPGNVKAGDKITIKEFKDGPKGKLASYIGS